MSNPNDKMPERAIVEFHCHGTATGKMRNDLEITMVRPFKETFTMATDEGAFHGGDANRPTTIGHVCRLSYRLYHDPDQSLCETAENLAERVAGGNAGRVGLAGDRAGL